jgi:hypothetical protein
MTIRGRERPKGWVPDTSDDQPPMESYWNSEPKADLLSSRAR